VVEPHAFIGKTKRLLQLLVETKRFLPVCVTKSQLSRKHPHVSMLSSSDKNTSKTKVLLQKLTLGCTLLFWFEIKLALVISNQLHLKRIATSMMSSCMTSPALFIQMPLNGLWS